jgi:signal peptidase II
MSSQSPADTPAAFMPSFNPRMLFTMIAGVVAPIVALDQASKHYVSAHMQLYESIQLIPNWLDITYTRNPGVAFSMFANAPEGARTAMLLVLASAAIVVLVVLIAAADRPTVVTVALALILAGAGGNLIDRATHGEVIDFVRAHYYSYNWPIFNVADSSISIGVTLILLSSFRSKLDPQ